MFCNNNDTNMKKFSLKEIQTFFKRARSSSLGDHEFVSPTRDWSIALMVHTMLLLGVIVFAITTYYRVESSMVIRETTNVNEEIQVDRSELTQALQFFETRTQSFGEQKNTLPVIVDPGE